MVDLGEEGCLTGYSYWETHTSSFLYVLILSFVLPWEQSWRFGVSVSSKPAQEMHSTTGDCLSPPSSGLAAPGRGMVLVVDINGDCWRSATWGVISISSDLICMISSLWFYNNSYLELQLLTWFGGLEAHDPLFRSCSSFSQRHFL